MSSGAPRGEEHPGFEVQPGGRAAPGRGEVQDQVAEAADGARDVRADRGQVVGVHRVALGGQDVRRVGDVQGGGVYGAVRYQLIELHDPLLVVGVVVADQLSADHQVGGEVVERLGAVGDRCDVLAQLRLGQVPQERDRADHTA